LLRSGASFPPAAGAPRLLRRSPFRLPREYPGCCGVACVCRLAFGGISALRVSMDDLLRSAWSRQVSLGLRQMPSAFRGTPAPGFGITCHSVWKKEAIFHLAV